MVAPKRRWWRCEGDHSIRGPDGTDGDPDRVLAATAAEAACEWASARGHDPDDNPIVTVSAKGEPTRRFVLSARVIWKAQEDT